MFFIDGHTHAYTDQDLPRLEQRLGLLDGSLSSSSPYRWELVHRGDLASLIESEKEAGVERFVLLPVAGRPEKVGFLNRWAAQAAADHPAVIPFASLHPLAENVAGDLAEALMLGLKGVKIHTLLQHFHLLSPQSLRMLEAIEAVELPVLLDTVHAPGLLKVKPHLAAFSDEFGPFATDATDIAQVAARFPRLKIIAAHMGCLYGWDHVAPLLDLDNVYFDLAFVDRLLSRAETLGLIRRKGAARVIWGTDCPWRAVAPALKFFLDLDLNLEEKTAVAAGNLLGLLGP